MLQDQLSLMPSRARLGAGLSFSLSLLLPACGGDDGAAETSGTEGASSTEGEVEPAFEPVLLDCPMPGTLPFSTQASAFDSSEAETVVQDLPRIKDEGSDILGNPGGAVAFTHMALTDAPSMRFVHEGKKARTAMDTGLEVTPVASEWVSLWRYDGSDWHEEARTQTDHEGTYAFTGIDPGTNVSQPIYSILEGEGSCTPHHALLLEPGTPVVVTDIDGTLTLGDEELTTQINDGTYVPVEMGSASTMLNTWADKGYFVAYLTARPHVFRSETRRWLDDRGFPPGPVISSNTFVYGDSARGYKATWVTRLISELGWDVVAAYGDATSDIGAYEDAGVPKNVTFIVGEHAGVDGTQPIENLDYADHIAAFVASQPEAR